MACWNLWSADKVTLTGVWPWDSSSMPSTVMCAPSRDWSPMTAMAVVGSLTVIQWCHNDAVMTTTSRMETNTAVRTTLPRARMEVRRGWGLSIGGFCGGRGGFSISVGAARPLLAIDLP